jgi:hypothetical protein
MVAPTHRTCPSCQSRLSPLAVECTECGLSLTQARQGRRLLFQATALAKAPGPTPSRALTAPALGRIAPIAVEVSPEELQPTEGPAAFAPPAPPPSGEVEAVGGEAGTSFWPLVKVEVGEAALLLGIQALALALPAALLGVSPTRLLLGAWAFVVPYLVVVSWLFFLAPLTLTGQSPLMRVFGVTLPEPSPDRRVAFSLLHLVSVMAFPLSFLCMVLSRRHQTLAEFLSGQELMALSKPRAR